MILYTIGSGQKTARDFFTLLKDNAVKLVIDIRLANTSQLAGFTKKGDLEYFLGAVAGIEYRHMPEFAPTEELMTGIKTKKLSWSEYENEYARLLVERKALAGVSAGMFVDACLLCSEPSAGKCHRRLLAEYLAARIPGLDIVHL